LTPLALASCLLVGLVKMGAAEPAINIQRAAADVLLEWPEDSLRLGYVLESAPTVTHLIWNPVPGVVTNSILITPSETAQFFRLNDSATNGSVLSGIAQSGGTSESTPLAGVAVALFEAGDHGPTMIAQGRTDAAGRFALRSPKATADGIFFVTAWLNHEVELVAILGPSLPGMSTVNELTTVAAAYSMAQFYRDGSIRGDPFGLRIAALMNDNLVDVAAGTSSPVLLNSPNGDQSNSLRSTRALANLLAACVEEPAIAREFLELALEPLLPAPTTVAQAMANLARNPGQNVSDIYVLSTVHTPYAPTLFEAPDAWTVTVKVNDSGDDNHLISGAGNMVFDSNGYAWISNNTIQGTPYSSRFMVVLQPNGKPADGVEETPRSPITTGGLLGGAYGITLDPQGSVWVGNFGWGPDKSCLFYPATNCNGSVSQFTTSGEAISGPLGYQGGPVRAQGMASDAEGNIWICSFGNDAVYVFLKGSPTNVAYFQEYTGSGPFDVEIAADGSAVVTCGGGLEGEFPASVTRLQLVGNQIRRVWQVHFGQALKGLSLDSKGNAWVSSQGDDQVYVLAPDGTVLGGYAGGGVDGPWGAAVDGEDNVWIANFGPLDRAPFSSRISKLAGADHNKRPPGLNLGDPISPATGYTVPSAGSEVLLHDGTPLYGPDGPVAYDPMQRVTAMGIDRAGNLWALNNWKNKFAIDVGLVGDGNPGGDGVVIFVGLAAPPRRTSTRSYTPSLTPAIYLINFLFLYTANPEVAANLPAYKAPIPQPLVDCLEQSPSGCPYAAFRHYFEEPVIGDTGDVRCFWPGVCQENRNWEHLAPGEATQSEQINEPIGKERARQLAQLLGITEDMILTEREYHCLVGTPSSRTTDQETFFRCIYNMTNSRGNAVIPLSSYGLNVNERGDVRSICATDSPCLMINSLLSGYLEKTARECGFLEKLVRLETQTPFNQLIGDANACQQSAGAACLVKTVCAGKQL